MPRPNRALSESSPAGSHSITGVIPHLSFNQRADSSCFTHRNAAEEALTNEACINAIELEIDALAIDVLALHQPMAKDLRFIMAALKINTATNIAEDVVFYVKGIDFGYNSGATK